MASTSTDNISIVTSSTVASKIQSLPDFPDSEPSSEDDDDNQPHSQRPGLCCLFMLEN